MLMNFSKNILYKKKPVDLRFRSKCRKHLFPFLPNCSQQPKKYFFFIQHQQILIFNFILYASFHFWGLWVISDRSAYATIYSAYLSLYTQTAVPKLRAFFEAHIVPVYSGIYI